LNIECTRPLVRHYRFPDFHLYGEFLLILRKRGLEDAHPARVTLSDIDAARQLPILRHPCRAGPINKADGHIVIVNKNIIRREVSMSEADAIRLLTNARLKRAHCWISTRRQRAIVLGVKLGQRLEWAHVFIVRDTNALERSAHKSADGRFRRRRAQPTKLSEPSSHGIREGGELRIGKLIASTGHSGKWCAGDACHEYEGSTSGVYEHIEDGRHGNVRVDGDVVSGQGFCDTGSPTKLCVKAER